MRRALRLRRPAVRIWLLLAAALFMRAVMTSGYMAEARGGEIVVDICNSDAKWRIALPARPEAPGAQDRQAPCAFAGLAQAALDVPPTVHLAVPIQPAELHAAAPVRPFATAPPRLRPPATGPPLPA